MSLLTTRCVDTGVRRLVPRSRLRGDGGSTTASSPDPRCHNAPRLHPQRSPPPPPPPAARRPPPASFEIQLKHDPTIYDGRFANNGWLQELPKPQTKITWENVLLVSPKTARDINYPDKEREALVNERHTILVDLTYRGRTLRVPLWVIPGHPDNCGTLYFGYGRETGGHIAAPSDGLVGVNVYPLRFSDAMGGGGGAHLARSGEAPYKIA